MEPNVVVSRTEDMLAILFPHMYEDIEYLVQDEDVVISQSLMSPRSARVVEHVNAEAGPSRSVR